MLRADNELALEETFGKKLHKQAKIKSRDHLISAILQELQTEDVRRKRKYSTRNSVVSRCETKEEEAKQSKQNREKSAKLQSLDDLNDKITRIINDISVSCRINQNSVSKRGNAKQTCFSFKKNNQLYPEPGSIEGVRLSNEYQCLTARAQDSESKRKRQTETKKKSSFLMNPKKTGSQIENITQFSPSQYKKQTTKPCVSQPSKEQDEVELRIKIITEKIDKHHLKIKIAKEEDKLNEMASGQAEIWDTKANGNGSYFRTKNESIGEPWKDQLNKKLSDFRVAIKIRKRGKENEPMNEKNNFKTKVAMQVSFDRNLRHAKHLFSGLEELNKGEKELKSLEKWRDLSDKLRKQGISMSLRETIETFAPKGDQIDPFLSVSRSHEQLAYSLISAYKQSQKHWQKEILNQWTHWSLADDKFTIENVDRERKGYISLTDLTNYLNTQVDGQYRNRDLMLIYKRFKQLRRSTIDDQPMKFKDILQMLLRK